MRKLLFILSLILAMSIFAQELVVYTYSSFASGIARKVLPIFEKQHNVTVKLQSFGKAGNVLARLILEKEQPKADVVIGLDGSLLRRAILEGLLVKFTPQNISRVKDAGLLDEQGYGTPFDYGAIALVTTARRSKILQGLLENSSMRDSKENWLSKTQELPVLDSLSCSGR